MPDLDRVGPGQSAQPGGAPGERLVRLALGRVPQDASDLDEQVGPTSGELAECVTVAASSALVRQVSDRVA
jgi:hypothetical protein